MKWINLLKDLLAGIAEGFFKALLESKAKKDKEQEAIEDQEDFHNALATKDTDHLRKSLDSLVRKPPKDNH